MGLQPTDVIDAYRSAQLPQQRRLNQSARTKYGTRFLDRRTGHEGAPIGYGDDHAFMAQPRQDFPYPGSADVEYAGQLFLDQFGAWREPVLHERGKDALVDGIARAALKRLGGSRAGQRADILVVERFS